MTLRFTSPQSPRAALRRRRFASIRSVGALMLREMATTYGKSPGGYAWAVLEPVAGVAILTYAFSFLFEKPPLGTSFELFYATGTLPFFMFTTISNRVSTALLFSKPLLAYPAVTYIDALIARFMVNLFTELFVFYIVMVGVLTLYDTRAVVDVPHVALSLGLTALFALGVGTLNAYLFMRWHIWHVAWAIISRPLFIISGTFFMYDRLPMGLKEWLWYNPLIQTVGLMRRGFYPTYDDHYVSGLYVAGVSLALILTGLFLLNGSIKTLLYES